MSLKSLSYEDIYHYFANSIKESTDFTTGSEHELFCFDSKYRLIPYSLAPSHKATHSDNTSIEKLFSFFTRQKDYAPIKTDGVTLALSKGRTYITLEPGCQLELSGAPYHSLHDMRDEIVEYYQLLHEAQKEMDIHFAAIGMNPMYLVEEIPHLPKKRYEFMKAYFPSKGIHGQDMMFRTTTIQANFDFNSEDDMAMKMKVTTLLSPFINSMFANSVYLNKHDTGYKYYRSHIWKNTDPDRCGFLRFVFNKTFGFHDYIQWLLDIPMIFVKINNSYISTGSMTFRHFMDNGIDGNFPTLEHFVQQVSLAFPEVRLKTYLELRGADGGPPSHILALSAIWKGILYYHPNLEKAYQLIEHLTFNDLTEISEQVSKHAIHAKHKKIDFYKTLLALLEISKAGLEHISQKNQNHHDESMYLKPLCEILENKQTLADKTKECMKNKDPFLQAGDLFHFSEVKNNSLHAL